MSEEKKNTMNEEQYISPNIKESFEKKQRILGIVFALVVCWCCLLFLQFMYYFCMVKCQTMEDAVRLITGFESYLHKIESLFIDYKVEIYLTQISASFITITVLSIFSDQPKKVYWENVVNKELKNPPIANFHSITKYSLICLLINFFLLGVGKAFGTVIFAAVFAFNIFLLSHLTKKMVGVYFGEKRRRADLEREFYNDMNINSIKETQFGIVTRRKRKKEFIGYKNSMLLLKSNTREALENGSIEDFSYNIEFFFKYFWKIGENDLSFLQEILKNEKGKELYYVFAEKSEGLLECLNVKRLFDLVYNEKYIYIDKIFMPNKMTGIQYSNLIRNYMCVEGGVAPSDIPKRFAKMAVFLKCLYDSTKKSVSSKGKNSVEDSILKQLKATIERFCRCSDFLFDVDHESEEIDFNDKSWWKEATGTDIDDSKITEMLSRVSDHKYRGKEEKSDNLWKFRDLKDKEVTGILNKRVYVKRILENSFISSLEALLIFFVCLGILYWREPAKAAVGEFTLNDFYNIVWGWDEVHAGEKIKPGEENYHQLDCRIGEYIKIKDDYYVEAYLDDKETIYLKTTEDYSDDECYTIGSKKRLIGTYTVKIQSIYSKNVDLVQGRVINVVHAFDLPYQYTFKP